MLSLSFDEIAAKLLFALGAWVSNVLLPVRNNDGAG
jgi:hypothetical protein